MIYQLAAVSVEGTDESLERTSEDAELGPPSSHMVLVLVPLMKSIEHIQGRSRGLC